MFFSTTNSPKAREEEIQVLLFRIEELQQQTQAKETQEADQIQIINFLEAQMNRREDWDSFLHEILKPHLTHSLLRFALIRWKLGAQLVKQERLEAFERADIFDEYRLKRACWSHWCILRDKKLRHAQQMEMARTTFLSKFLFRWHSALREKQHRQREKQFASEKYNRTLLWKWLLRWRTLANGEQPHPGSSRCREGKERLSHLGRLLQNRESRSLLRKFFVTWRIATLNQWKESFLHLREGYNRMRASTSEKIVSQPSFSSTVQDELEHIVEDSNNEQQRLENRIQGLLIELEDVKRQHENTTHIAKLEKESTYELQQELEEKQKALDGCTKQLKETYGRLDGENAETQEKLNMAFDIASSLRKLLDEKEAYLEQLKIAKEEAENNAEEYRTRCLEANTTIQVQQQQVEELQQQLEAAQNTSHDFASLLERRDFQLERLSREADRHYSKHLNRSYRRLQSPSRPTSPPLKQSSRPSPQPSTNTQLESIYEEINSLQQKILNRLNTTPSPTTEQLYSG